MQRVFFDTNALNYLVDSGLECAAREAVTRSRFESFLTHPLSFELAGVYRDPIKYGRLVDLACFLARNRVLDTVGELIAWEVHCRGRAPELRAFTHYPDLPFQLKNVEGAAEVDQIAFDVRHEFCSSEKERRSALLAKTKSLSQMVKATQRWGQAISASQIADWAEHLREDHATKVWGRDRSCWPAARRQPALWHYISYLVGRIARVLGENHKIDGNDGFDWCHFASAAYADVLVTDDKRFVQTIEFVQEHVDVRVISFAQFSNEFLN